MSPTTNGNGLTTHKNFTDRTAILLNNVEVTGLLANMFANILKSGGAGGSGFVRTIEGFAVNGKGQLAEEGPVSVAVSLLTGEVVAIGDYAITSGDWSASIKITMGGHKIGLSNSGKFSYFTGNIREMDSERSVSRGQTIDWIHAGLYAKMEFIFVEFGPTPTIQTDFDFYAGLIVGTFEEIFHSKIFKTWLGKDWKIRSQNWGSNQRTGGKNKYALKNSILFKRLGFALGLYGMSSTQEAYEKNLISKGQMFIEQGSNLISTFGGMVGA